jgi:8-oxo-dGTP pyrophosphatase MutT (NUDIX family)
VLTAAQKALLLIWRRLPRLMRRWIVRTVAPSFTVGAACVVEDGEGSILLVRLVYREAWGLPGGLIKRNEDVATCARREVSEEIGIDVELVGDPAVVVDSPPQRVDVVFRARPAGAFRPGDAYAKSVEIREVRWFPATDLPALQHEAVTALVALSSTAVAPDTGPRAADPGDGAADIALRHAAAEAARQRRSAAS